MRFCYSNYIKKIPCQHRVPEVCYDCREDSNFSRSVPGIFWSTSWGQLMLLTRLGLQGFVMTSERLVIGLVKVLCIGLLVIQFIQISLVEMQCLQLKVVHSVPQLVIHTFNLSLDPPKFILFLVYWVYDFGFPP